MIFNYIMCSLMSIVLSHINSLNIKESTMDALVWGSKKDAAKCDNH